MNENENNFDPFGVPLKKMYSEDNPIFTPKTTLKSVFCSYMGRLTVYDVRGQKVQDLSGALTYEKHIEIQERTDPDITEFEGIEDYKRLAADLKSKEPLEEEEQQRRNAE